MKPKITIHGSYGTGNRGDNVILFQLLRLLKGTLPESEITILCRDEKRLVSLLAADAELASMRIAIVPASFRRAFFRVFRASSACDVFILGGGGLFWGSALRNLAYWSIRPFIALICRKKLVIYVPGIFNIKGALALKLLGSLARRAHFLSVRDLESLKILKKAGLKESQVLLGADPALLLAPSSLDGRALIESLGLSGRKLVGISARDWRMRRLAALFTNHVQQVLADPRTTVLFFAQKVGGDYGETDANDLSVAKDLKKTLAPQLQERFLVLGEEFSTDEVITLMGACDYLLGMRLHALIFATLAGTPFGAVTFDEKIVAYMRMVGREEFLLMLEEVHVKGRLAAVIKRLETERRRYPAPLPVPGIREIAVTLSVRARMVHDRLAQTLRAWFPAAAGGPAGTEPDS